jgi:hypothetical protein
MSTLKHRTCRPARRRTDTAVRNRWLHTASTVDKREATQNGERGDVRNR